MGKFKDGRIEILNNNIQSLKETMKLYNVGSPAWTLMQAALGHVNSLYHLEAQTSFDDETMGVRFKDEKK